MKKVLYTIGLALLAVSCTEDFKDWANPFKNDPEAAKSMSMTINPVGTIDLATVTADTVQIFSPTIAIEDESETTYKTVVYGPEGSESKVEFDVDAKGNVPKDVLETAVYALYGQRPVLRNIPMDVTGYVKVGGQTFKATGNTTLSVIPNAPEIDAAYYLTGTLNGWDNTDKTYKLTNDGSDPYENPVYTCRIPAPDDGSDIEFKMTPESGIGGDWSKCLAAGDEGKFKYNNDGGNFVIKAVAGAKFYDLTFNMLDQTWSYKALLFDIEQNWYFTGTLNGWNNSDTTYKLTNDGSDPYANPTFTMRIPASDDGSNIEFKMTPESGLGGNWSKCLAAGATPGTFVYNNEGGNLVIEAVAGAKFYDLTFNMMELTWSYKAISFSDYIYLACDFNGWSTDASPLIHLGDGAYEGFYYIQEADEATTWGFKFVIDGSWSGGDHAKATSGSFELGGGGNLNCPTGFYQVKVNQANATWTLTEVTTMSIIGTVNGNWDTDTDLTFNTATKAWETTATLNAGEFKFRMNHDWSISWGGTAFDNLTNQNGPNMKVESAGQYKVQFWPNCNGMGKYTLTPAN